MLVQIRHKAQALDTSPANRLYRGVESRLPGEYEDLGVWSVWSFTAMKVDS